MPSSTWNWPWLISAGSIGDAGLVHRRAIAVDPGAAAQDPVRPADDGDPPVAEPEQVTRRGQAAVPVRRPDGRRVVERLAGRVDHHERDAARRSCWRIDSLRSEKTAITPVGWRASDALDPAAARRPAALHLREDDRQVVATGDALDAADDLERPFAVETRGRSPRGSGRRRTPRGVRLVALLAGSPPRRAGGSPGDVRSAVDDLRDRRHRNAGLPRRCPRSSSGPAAAGVTEGQSSCRQCSDLRRRAKVSRAAIWRDLGPNSEARRGRFRSGRASGLTARKSAAYECPSRNYRQQFRNFRGGDESAGRSMPGSAGPCRSLAEAPNPSRRTSSPAGRVDRVVGRRDTRRVARPGMDGSTTEEDTVIAHRPLIRRDAVK